MSSQAVLRGWQSNLRATHLSLPAPFLLFGVTTLERSAMWFMRTRRSAHKGSTMDRSLKAVLVFTLVYGLFSAAMLSGQPYVGRTQVADAGGNFETSPQGVYIRLASAE